MKKILAILLAMLLLTACVAENDPPAETTGGDTTTDGGTTAPTSTEPVTTEPQITAQPIDSVFTDWLDQNSFHFGYLLDTFLNRYHYEEISMGALFTYFVTCPPSSVLDVYTKDEFLKDRFDAVFTRTGDNNRGLNSSFSFWSELMLDDLPLPCGIDYGDSLAEVLASLGVAEETVEGKESAVLYQKDEKSVTFFDLSGSTDSETPVYSKKIVYTDTSKTETKDGEYNTTESRSVTLWFDGEQEGSPFARIEMLVDGKKQVNGVKGLTYSLLPDESGYAVTGMGSCTDAEVRIPFSHQGKDVVAIADGAFRDCESLVNLILPDTVVEIGKDAFSGCKNLISFESPFPSELTTIGDRAFWSCISLNRVEITKTVTTIGDQAFYGCTSLKEIKLPGFLENVGEGMFAECSALEKVLEFFLKTVSKEMFFNCDSLKDVTFFQLEQIGDRAFSSCDQLKNITIAQVGNARLTSIGEEALDGCTVLSRISFEGSLAEWQSVSKAESWDDNCGAYALHCKDQIVTPTP